MRPERPLLPPLPPLPPPAQSSQEADMDLPAGRLPDPVPSPILKHSLSVQSRSLRSAADGTSSVHFAADFRSRSKTESTSPSLDSFRTARSRPPSVSRSSTRRSASERLGSQRDLRDEDARFVYINDAPRTNAPPAVFPDNSVHTAKYSVLTFIPRNLYEQFRRVANVYFLILAMLNFVPQLLVFSPVAGILPLSIVLAVTAVKDGYEDWRRHRSDKNENNRTASVLVDGVFRPKRWKEMQVGDVVRVVANETLPCDMVLLSTSDPTGVAYVQTINLDGESNLKTRYAKQETMVTPTEALAGVIKCEKPNRNIYGFLATVDLDGRRAVSLGTSSILLRGCELKNTAWAIGVAVYTGSDTKVMLNNSGAPSKRSRLDTQMNRETIALAVILVLLCSTVAILDGIWLGDHNDELGIIPFFRKYDYSSLLVGKYDWFGTGAQVAFTFMSGVIQFQVIIPIALFISMEVVRAGQAYFMVQDNHMFDDKSKARFQCRALNINEDLGQIKYVFSDKTGTLTENKMEFRCASVHGRDFSETDGGGEEDRIAVLVDGVVIRPKTSVKTDPKLTALLKDGTGAMAGRARDLFLALATCNTIVPIVEDTADPAAKLLEYQGESPDEQALVYAAAAYGHTLVERTSGHIIVDVFGTRQRSGRSARARAHAMAEDHGSSRNMSAMSMSHKELGDEDARVVRVGDAARTNERLEFAGNAVRTAKYSPLTFLPRNLFEQFHRLAYVYFLVIAVLNQLPQLAVFGRGASVLPLAIVLTVTAVKDAYEDWRRHRSDRVENSRLAAVLSPGAGAGAGAQLFDFVPTEWKHVRVGDVVRVEANESPPADMVLLATSDATGVAYVQTLNLDGESNLKTRYAKQETLTTPLEQLAGAVIRCERPNRNIYGFQANLDLPGESRRIPLGPSNIVLRGCDLKNTSWAVGVVVYAGRETKAMLNNAGTPTKRSRLETNMNRETLFLSVILIVLCSLVAALSGVWLRTHQTELELMQFFHKKDYLKADKDDNNDNYNYYGIAAQIVFNFLMAVIVFQIMIPISLYISMELVRLGQAYFMIRDAKLYDESSDSRFQCRALNINEDLGQVKCIFSDKTGTLTQNKMEFRCATIDGVDYSDITRRQPVEGEPAWVPKVPVNVDREVVELVRNGGDTEQGRNAMEFFLALATCNTIVPLILDGPDPKKKKVIDYQGESPDEQALVSAAAAYGFVLVERTSGHIVIDVLGQKQRFDVLGLHEFDSDRKRMSVIIGCPDKTVKLFVKGADSSMFGIIDKTLNPDVVQATEKHLHSYSSVGLRTLVIGVRELSQAEFQEWQMAYEKASTALLGRGNLLRSVAANIERNMRLLGASGIEDKLQEGVPEAIEKLRQAGIKVWVLTGDKQETAISIGYSCKLLTRDMTQIVINSNSRESCRKSLDDAISMVNKLRSLSTDSQSRVPLALIIDGNSLVYIFDTDREEKLFEVAIACDVVLCCRVAPLQKAGIVDLIKKRTSDMTLAIGDGANDVSMIQMADVGIGISGQEGRQAVMASDFAMGQFRFLVPLLLVHGHWNYQRMGYMILYNFYRNATFVFVLFWYVLYTGYTLTTAITEWSSVLYSVIYTAVPTVVVAILDKDLSRRTLLKYPQLYGAGQREENYNLRLFIFIMMDSIWQSIAVFFIPYLAYRNSAIDSASLGDLWTLAVVILVNIHLAMDVIRWTWVTHAAIWGSIVATWICVIVIDSIPSLPGFWAIYEVMGTGLFWALLLAVIVVGMIPHFAAKAIKEHFMPNDIQIAREMEKSQDSHDVSHPEVQMSTIDRA